MAGEDDSLDGRYTLNVYILFIFGFIYTDKDRFLLNTYYIDFEINIPITKIVKETVNDVCCQSRN